MNVLKREKQVLAVSMLADGASVRSVERVLHVHRDTICKLLVRTGKRCQGIMDEELTDLCFNALELDELWSFVYKKQARVKDGNPNHGDQFIYVAQCPETKLVPCFRLGKRTPNTTHLFMADLASRVAELRQVSTDGYGAYLDAVAERLGRDVAHMVIIKKYATNGDEDAQRRYSPPHCVGMDRHVVRGYPRLEWSTTSHVEAQNVGCRMACKRLARLTLCFSKKWENLLAALRLHYCEFNFVRKHRTLGTTPAVAAGLTDRPWPIEWLVEGK